MNILVLFSYGSLHTIDDVADFYDHIFHGTASKENIQAGIEKYDSLEMADPLGANTNRIGRALIKRLEKATEEKWEMYIANHHAKPSIDSIAKICGQKRAKRVVTCSLTPFHSITGNRAYEKKFAKYFQAGNSNAQLIHITPYAKHQPFINVLTDRAKTARDWLPACVKDEAEIIFTAHSMPGIPDVHRKMISQYEYVAKQVATTVGVKKYHIAYRSGNPGQRWLEPDVLEVVTELNEQKVKAVVFVEALSIIENMEVIQEITHEAIALARSFGMKAVQSEYLNDSVDFIEALELHLLKEIT